MPAPRTSNCPTKAGSQATALAERLKDDDVAAVYCSPMKRTVETASIIAAPHSLTPIRRSACARSITAVGKDGRAIRGGAQFSSEYQRWEQDPLTFAPERGECGLDVMARSLPVIRRIVEAHAGDNVVVVSHKATIRLLISSILGFEHAAYRDRLDQAPACLNVLDFKDPVRARLMLFNDISHYGEHPRRPSAHLSKWWDQGKA